MGGMGLGNRGFRGRCEDMHPVDLADLNRRGLKAGTVCAMRWMRSGRERGRAEVALQAKSRVRLHHVELLEDGAKTYSSATVSLISTKQPLGGVREWFECPCCRRPCRVLYGRAAFRCRLCANLIYASQVEHAPGRARLEAQKLRMRLGGSPSLGDPFPDKPRTMHWKNYRKMKQRHDRLTGLTFAHLSAKLEKWHKGRRPSAGPG